MVLGALALVIVPSGTATLIHCDRILTKWEFSCAVAIELGLGLLTAHAWIARAYYCDAAFKLVQRNT